MDDAGKGFWEGGGRRVEGLRLRGKKWGAGCRTESQRGTVEGQGKVTKIEDIGWQKEAMGFSRNGQGEERL